MGALNSFALTNGRILVPSSDRCTLELHPTATAISVEEGLIAAIGTDDEIVDRIDSRTRIVDTQGSVVSPGLIDAHIHAFDCAVASLKVSLLPPGVDRVDVLKHRLADRAASQTSDSWVIGEGYDDMRMAERRHPTRFDLDEAVPDRPVIVTRVCGHMGVANSRALGLAGIDAATADPVGGAIVRDGAGQPTGLLLEEAQGLVSRLVPPADAQLIEAALQRTGSQLLAYGITTICEALLGAFHANEAAIWSRLFGNEPRFPTVRFLIDGRLGASDVADELPVIGTKLFADGVVTGRTAAVSEPFEATDEAGMLMYEPKALAAEIRDSAARGLPVGIHAMGDRGIQVAVDAIEALGPDALPPSRARGDDLPVAPYRIEHCSLPSQESLAKMRRYGIVPVPQPVFLYAEGEAYKEQLGESRVAHAYPLRTMTGMGLRPAISSDAPATSLEDAFDPWPGIITAVTRRTWAGSQLGSAESLSVAEAIACSTMNGAAALSIEDRTGSIEVGKDADLMVLKDDPLSLPVEDLGSLRPELVSVKGGIAHASQRFASFIEAG